MFFLLIFLVILHPIRFSCTSLHDLKSGWPIDTPWTFVPSWIHAILLLSRDNLQLFQGHPNVSIYLDLPYFLEDAGLFHIYYHRDVCTLIASLPVLLNNSWSISSASAAFLFDSWPTASYIPHFLRETISKSLYKCFYHLIWFVKGFSVVIPFSFYLICLY